MIPLIQEHPDNDLILAQMLASEVQSSRYNRSSRKVCNDLGIDYIDTDVRRSQK